ncbi:hypothetical protein AB0L28_34315 [Streptomyces sp. NPDC052503]|nr:hypothetical protein [Streptomyces sp. SID7834]MYT56045.1 hypothetical protein [Streptomyces sp. SID7834]MYT60737.1 hypothetical protein [Streptomyces sp. SID7834]
MSASEIVETVRELSVEEILESQETQTSEVFGLALTEIQPIAGIKQLGT